MWRPFLREESPTKSIECEKHDTKETTERMFVYTRRAETHRHGTPERGSIMISFFLSCPWAFGKLSLQFEDLEEQAFSSLLFLLTSQTTEENLTILVFI